MARGYPMQLGLQKMLKSQKAWPTADGRLSDVAEGFHDVESGCSIGWNDSAGYSNHDCYQHDYDRGGDGHVRLGRLFMLSLGSVAASRLFVIERCPPTKNTSCEKLREFPDGRIGLRAKRIFTAVDGLPFPNLVGLESQRMGIGDTCLTQVLQRNLDGCLAITR